MLVCPPNRHVFRRNRVVTKMTPVRGHRKIERTMIVFDPPAPGRDRIISGTSTRGESKGKDYKECQSHGPVDTLRTILDHPGWAAV